MGSDAASVISTTTYATSNPNYYPVYEITATVVSVATIYTAIVTDGNCSWDKTLPDSPATTDFLVYTGSGEVAAPTDYASYGSITIGENVTITGISADNALAVKGNGVVKLTGTETLTEFPLQASAYSFTSPTIEIAQPVIVDVDSADDIMPIGNKSYILNADITAERMRLGNQSGVTQTYLQIGGTVTLSGSNGYTSNQSTMLIGHWASTTTYSITGGTLSVPNEAIRLGWSSSAATLAVGGGKVATKGIVAGYNGSYNNPSIFTLSGGEIELGEVGLNLNNQTTTTLSGGTITFTKDAQMTALKGMTINNAVTVSVAEGYTATLNTTINEDSTGYIKKVGAGTLDVGSIRPTIDLAEGGIKLTATSAEIESGALVLAIPENATEYTGSTTTTVVDSNGNTVDILKTTVDNDNHTVTLTLDVNTAITETCNVSDKLSTSTSGMVIIAGPTDDDADPITVTFDMIPSSATFTVTGKVNLVPDGTNVTEIPFTAFTFDSGSTVTLTSAPAAATALSSGATLVLDASNADMTVSGAISGAGAVKTIGNVKFTTDNTFTGGLTVTAGTVSTTVNSGLGGTGATAGNATITVVDGGCLDLANTADYCYALVIAGKGVANEDGTYSGAVKNTGSAIGTNSRQTWMMTLSADATIDASNNWGLINGSWSSTTLNLNGYTLTKIGTAAFWLVNTTVDAGKIAIAEGYVEAVANGVVLSDAVTIDVAENAAFRVGTNISGTATTFTGSGEVRLAGGSLPLGSNPTLPVSFVALENTTSTLAWTNTDSNAICDTDSKTAPFLTINSGATLNIYGHDYSGWNGKLRDTGWVVNSGTLVFQNDGGSRFWREHIVMGDESVIQIDNGARNLLVYGGVGSADACQFMLAEGTAMITSTNETFTKNGIYLGNDGSGNYGDNEDAGHGAGFSIGEDATLTVEVPLAGSDTLAKYGAGTLILACSDNDYKGTVSLNAGTIKSTTALTVQKGDGAKGYQLSTWTETVGEGDDTVTYHCYGLKKQFIIRLR